MRAYSDFVIRGLGLQEFTHYAQPEPNRTIVITYMARRGTYVENRCLCMYTIMSNVAIKCTFDIINVDPTYRLVQRLRSGRRRSTATRRAPSSCATFGRDSAAERWAAWLQTMPNSWGACGRDCGRSASPGKASGISSCKTWTTMVAPIIHKYSNSWSQ